VSENTIGLNTISIEEARAVALVSMRKCSGLSQKGLAAMMSMCSLQVLRWERGYTPISELRLYDAGHFCGFNAEEVDLLMQEILDA
jgi:hypothetical protein